MERGTVIISEMRKGQPHINTYIDSGQEFWVEGRNKSEVSIGRRKGGKSSFCAKVGPNDPRGKLRTNGGLPYLQEIVEKTVSSYR